jgi:hypothetical protein
MSEGDRWSTLAAIALHTRDELAGLMSGSIYRERMSPSAAFQSALRRLRRIYKAADHLGDFVGQPELKGTRAASGGRIEFRLQ